MKAFIGIIHMIWSVFISIYAFIISKAREYDFYYIGYILLLVVSWLTFNDECLITYLYKKSNDHAHRIGDDPNNLMDLKDVFGKDFAKNLINVTIILTITSIVLVSKRSSFAPFYVWILFVLFFALYLLIQRKFYAPRFFDAHLKKHNPAFRILFFGITLTYLCFLGFGKKLLKILDR